MNSGPNDEKKAITWEEYKDAIATMHTNAASEARQKWKLITQPWLKLSSDAKFKLLDYEVKTYESRTDINEKADIIRNSLSNSPLQLIAFELANIALEVKSGLLFSNSGSKNKEKAEKVEAVADWLISLGDQITQEHINLAHHALTEVCYIRQNPLSLFQDKSAEQYERRVDSLRRSMHINVAASQGEEFESKSVKYSVINNAIQSVKEKKIIMNGDDKKKLLKSDSSNFKKILNDIYIEYFQPKQKTLSMNNK